MQNQSSLAGPGSTTDAMRVFTESAQRSFKRRATTACSWCQFRKIRCNVEESNPCSNCSLEKIECAITKRRKTKKDKSQDIGGVTQITSIQPRVPVAAPVQALESPRPEDANESPHHSAHDGVVPNPQSVSQIPNPVPSQTNIERLLSYNVPGSTLSVSPSMHSGTPSTFNDSTNKQKSPQLPVLPSYIAPIPEHLSADDLEYLQKKGSFDIPSEKFRNALICSYLEWSHVYYPMVQIDQFLDDICEPTDSNGKLSLLVFQAVLFVGSAHCDIKPLRMMGFMTRKAARKALFERTKALYHFGYEQNRISVIQALILMSLWYSTPDDQMDAYHWLSIAVTLARRASLNRDPASMNLPETERRQRKRIWWCCLIRDPLLALGLKRPIIIAPTDHDVPELTMDDFDIGDLTKAQETMTKLGVLWDIQKLRLVRLTCVAEAKLHQCLSQILSKQYELGAHHRESRAANPQASTAILLPLTTDVAWKSLSDCEERLRIWREGLPPELSSPALSAEYSDSTFDVVNVFRTMLHMIYHTSIITMYRPWLRASSTSQPVPNGPNNPIFQSRIRAAIRASAHSITNLAVELHKADLARHLPQTGVSAMVAAAVCHISDIASGDASVKESSQEGFGKCSHILNELRENYYSADFASEFVNLLARVKTTAKAAKARTGQDIHIQSFDFHEQSSAQRQFLAAGDTPSPEPLTPKSSIVLPAALFPKGTGLTSDLPVNEQNPLHADFEHANMSLDIPAVPADGTTSWADYNPDSITESGLFGDFFDDYHFSVFNALPGIDLGG